MKRREFGKALTAGSLGAVAAGCAQTEVAQTPAPKKKF